MKNFIHTTIFLLSICLISPTTFAKVGGKGNNSGKTNTTNPVIDGVVSGGSEAIISHILEQRQKQLAIEAEREKILSEIRYLKTEFDKLSPKEQLIYGDQVNKRYLELHQSLRRLAKPY